MKKNLTTLAFLAVLIILSISACGDSNEESVMEGVSVKPSEFVPFKVTSFEGQVIDLAKYRGNVVVINFWASWCGPCKMEAKELEAGYKANKTKGVKFVGVAVDDTESAARAFVKHYSVTYPNAIDADNSLSSRYQIFAIPTTFVLDKNGLIRYKRQGAITRESLEGEIKKAM